MNRSEFLACLNSKLAALPEEDISKSLDYYSEMIDDRIEDGMSEEQAVSELGDPEAIASVIIEETPLAKIVRERMRKRSSVSTGTVVLLVLGAPLWLPLLIAAAAVMLSLIIVLAALVISVYAVALALAVSSLALLAYGVVLLVNGAPSSAALALGCGLAAAGLTVLMFLASKYSTVLFIKLCRASLRAVKRLFAGKGGK